MWSFIFRPSQWGIKQTKHQENKICKSPMIFTCSISLLFLQWWYIGYYTWHREETPKLTARRCTFICLTLLPQGSDTHIPCLQFWLLALSGTIFTSPIFATENFYSTRHWRFLPLHCHKTLLFSSPSQAYFFLIKTHPKNSHPNNPGFQHLGRINFGQDWIYRIEETQKGFCPHVIIV